MPWHGLGQGPAMPSIVYAYRSALRSRPFAGKMPFWKQRALKRKLGNKPRRRGEALPQLPLATPLPLPVRAPARAPLVDGEEAWRGAGSNPLGTGMADDLVRSAPVKHRAGTAVLGPFRCKAGHVAMRYASTGSCTICCRLNAYVSAGRL